MSILCPKIWLKLKVWVFLESSRQDGSNDVHYCHFWWKKFLTSFGLFEQKLWPEKRVKFFSKIQTIYGHHWVRLDERIPKIAKILILGQFLVDIWPKNLQKWAFLAIFRLKYLGRPNGGDFFETCFEVLGPIGIDPRIAFSINISLRNR